MKKIFVSGANGFIARHTIKELQDRGYKVVSNARSKRKKNQKYLKDVEVYYKADIRDEAFMYKIIEQVDGVIHLAALLGTKHVRNAWNFYENNVLGTINILEACVEFNTPMVYIGVGNHGEWNNYSNTKTAAEREVLKYAKYCGVKANVVRALNAIGKYQKWKNTGKILPTFARLALQNKSLKVFGGRDNCGVMDLLCASDVAKVLVSVLEETDKGEYNAEVKEAGTGIAMPVFDIANKVVEFAESESKVFGVSMRKGESKGSVVKAENPYPIAYRDVDEVIKETIDWYREEFKS